MSLFENHITDEGGKALAGALKLNAHLTALTLTGNKIIDEGCKALTAALKINTSLFAYDGPGGPLLPLREREQARLSVSSVDLSRQGLGDVDVVWISHWLQHWHSDQALIVPEADAPDAPVPSVVTMLMELAQIFVSYGFAGLSKLNLNGNGITSVGASVLFTALRNPSATPQMVSLDILDNPIGLESVAELADMLIQGQHAQLQWVDGLPVGAILKNQLPHLNAGVLSEQRVRFLIPLLFMRALPSLEGRVLPDGVASLIVLFQANPLLTSLTFHLGNHMDLLEPLAQALTNTEHVTALAVTFDDVHMSKSVTLALADLVCRNASLATISPGDDVWCAVADPRALSTLRDAFMVSLANKDSKTLLPINTRMSFRVALGFELPLDVPRALLTADSTGFVVHSGLFPSAEHWKAVGSDDHGVLYATNFRGKPCSVMSITSLAYLRTILRSVDVDFQLRRTADVDAAPTTMLHHAPRLELDSCSAKQRIQRRCLFPSHVAMPPVNTAITGRLWVVYLTPLASTNLLGHMRLPPPAPALSLGARTRILIDVAEALAALHALGFVLRDLSASRFENAMCVKCM